MKKSIFLYFFMLLFASNSGAQLEGQEQLDYLFAELPKATTDTGRVMTLIAIAREYINSNPDSGLYYGNLALEQSQELNFTKAAEKLFILT